MHPQIFQQPFIGAAVIEAVLLAALISLPLYFILLRPMLSQFHVHHRDVNVLSDEEEQFKVMIHTSLDGFWITDMRGRFLVVNDVYCQLVGYSRDELLNMGIPDVEASESSEETARHVAKVIEVGGDRFETRHRCKDGRILDIEVSTNYSNLYGGRIYCFLRDITVRKFAEELLRESEEAFRATFHQAAVGIARVGMDGRWLEVNQRLCDIVGFSQEELRKRTFLDITHPDDLDRDLDYVRQMLDGAIDTYSMEKRYFRHSGEIVWVNLTVTMVRAGDGSPKYFISVIEDIQQRKQGEDRLIKLSQAVDQSTNTIFITDLDAKIEYVNAAFVRTSGYSADEVIGKNPHLLQSGKTPLTTYKSLWARLSHGESWQGEFINRRKDGVEYIGSMNISPLRQADGRITHYLAIEEDITERRRAEERIQYLANYDVLTGLPNRAQLDDHLKYALSLAKRSNGQLALMFLDIDHFKDINDTLGHKVGDALLVELAKRLKLVLREEDTVSRLGGDEFILLFPGTDPGGAAQVAQKMLDVITQPYRIEPYDLTVSASIGITVHPGDGEDLDTLSRNADTAMYRVKQEGRNGYRFFTPEMQAHSARNLMLVNALRHAMEEDQLHLHYQPQVSMKDGRIVGVEALLRWNHPELGAIPPAEFIPVAEESGLILQIGEWVLRTAVLQARTWQDSGLPPIVMAVNLSAVQFLHADLPELVSRILADVGLPPEYLELELTEGVAMHDPESAIEVMNDLHQRGVRMSIDDFGTGYSSLSSLKKFKVYKLKIDRSFVCDISIDNEDRAIVSAIIHMARSLDLQTIAEGVETDGQLAFLREQGCDEVQGYYYSKPLPAEQFEALARTGVDGSLDRG